MSEEQKKWSEFLRQRFPNRTVTETFQGPQDFKDEKLDRLIDEFEKKNYPEFAREKAQERKDLEKVRRKRAEGIRTGPRPGSSPNAKRNEELAEVYLERRPKLPDLSRSRVKALLGERHGLRPRASIDAINDGLRRLGKPDFKY